MTSLAAIFRAIAEALGLINRRTELKNSPEMQAAARAKQEQQQVDAATAATANRDLKQSREQLSEN